jgi:hypothetical protein
MGTKTTAKGWVINPKHRKNPERTFFFQIEISVIRRYNPNKLKKRQRLSILAVELILKYRISVKSRLERKNKEPRFNPNFCPIPIRGKILRSPARKDPSLAEASLDPKSFKKTLEYKKKEGGIHRVE